MFQSITQLLKNNLSLTSKNDITDTGYGQASQSLKRFLSQENDELSLKKMH